MDTATKYLWQSLSALDAPVEDAALKASPAKVVRLVEPAKDIGSGSLPSPLSPSKDWSKLIERVRHAANYAREVEAQAQEQELRVQEVLDRVREDVRNAAERVRVAEARTAEIQSRADAMLKLADERVKAAEERARIAEEWLTRVYDTIASEFTIEPDVKRTP
jgi:small-conductance mechanosensitive channel